MAWTALPPAEWLETEPEIVAASQYLQSSTPTTGLGFDTETTGLDIVRDRAILFSMSDGYRRFAAYAEPWLFHPAIRDALLNNPTIIKILTNAKFDRHMICNLGIPMVGPFHDTTVMDWLFNENRQGRHGLKETGRDYCNLQMIPFKDIFAPRRARKGCKVSKKNPNGIPAALAETAGEAIHRTMADPEGRLRAINYSGLDAFASVQVYYYLKARLQEIKMFPGEGRTLWDYFLAYEVPFTDVLWRLERRGFMIHTGHLLDQRGPMEEALREIELRLAQWAQWPVNPNSPKQLQKLFFDQLQIKPTKMTSGGKSGNKQPSTDDEVLQKFVGEAHPVAGPYAELILKHRGIAKIYGTYVEGLLGRVDTELRMHSTLNQHGAVTGRISSSDPNLQNIPRPKTDRFKIRKAFAAPPGRILVVSDYDQLEMKLMAHFCLHKQMTVSVPGSKGKMIGQLVNGQWTGEVYSYDTSSHKKVVRQVTDHFRNGLPVGEAPYRGGLKPEDWVVIRHEGTPWRKLIITPEHQVYTPTGKEPVSNLTKGDFLMHEEPWLRGYARQVLIGSLLGDGGFKRSKSDTGDGYFHSAAFYHGSAQKEYFDFKLGILTPFVHSHTFDGRMHRAKVTASFQIEELHRAMCGRRGGPKSKRPTIDILKQINEQGLAIWYLDDGSLQRDRRCSPTKGFSANIANSRITKKEIEFLNKKFGLKFKKWSRGMGLSGPSAERFFSIIAKWVPTCMNYKLPSYWRKEWAPEQLDLEQHDATPVKIIEIRKGDAAKDPMGFGSGSKFDITVEDTHNYFAQGILVSNSGDQKMIGAINNGMDLHCYTVHLMFGQRYEDAIGAKKAEKKKAEIPLTPEQEQLMLMRQSAKAVGFGLIYGIGSNKLGHQLTEELKRLVDRKEAQNLIQRYFAAFPGVKEFIDSTKEYCHRHEFVQTFLGRFRRLPEINAGGSGRRRFGQGDDEEQGNAGTAAMAERQSVNTIIQGTAADIAKVAMLISEYDGIMDSLDARLLLQVHDELIWECPDEPEIIKQVEERAQQIMQQPFEPYPFSIPLTCEAHHGYTWESAK